ncbi:hypothetical protein TVAG_437980 [Trichomonas vaginalis G3]|uniref:Right handed beta helix domain-containing protein n=1 Tax=Trichomonas vaginalis (strain ATCC PRA-98 / G3) TaxID=412133 RepID=A2FCF9_TRIV3|nr:pectin lyase-like family [Trichomonas vaginalis G3]EAX97419.1 hypothetical protein TVAG_437980 [Trichomonas vaginalis G3]KAI5516893.1 pectin lyase-like family [Trichomonas vaginalis G3]|eukprot:XP_001310349.1 hypothetical protein [Trichomonas vaginalis G3]
MAHIYTPDSFIKRSIFRNNTCKTGDSHWGLIGCDYSPSNVTVSECIFTNNKADHTFGTSSSAIITVINCTGDVLTADYMLSGSVYTNKMSTNSFDIPLSLLSLGKCEAEFPFSFEPILLRSKKKKKLDFEDLLSFNFSLECLFNLTSS